MAVTALLATSLMLLSGGCTTVTETGRTTLQFMPESELAVMANQEFLAMRQSTKVSTDPEKNRRLQEVGRRIVEAAIQRGAAIPPPDQWEFVLFEDDSANAFAMPGGKVGFFTGIFKYFDNDDELAVVMGHEVAHVAAGHGNQRVSRQLLIVGVGAGLGLAISGQDEATRTAILAGYGLGSQVGVALPFSRTEENEADHIGLIYMAQAGYDPRVAVAFWQKMDSGGPNVPEFLSTHPSGQTRIRLLRERIPEVMPIYERNKRVHLGPVYYENIAYYR